MKKLLIFVLMLFSFSGITILGADVNYNFNITDNFKWNLETGAIESDLKFAITSKMIIGNTNIETVAETYHHVVFWNNKNQYIGYKNTQYSILENDYYLGDIENGNLGFTAPANAHFFSFMIYKSGNRIPDPNLNNQSLFEIFGTYSTNNLDQKDNNELDGYDLDDLYNTQLESKNLFDLSNFNFVNLYVDSSSMSGTVNPDLKSIYISIDPNTQYTVSKIVDSPSSVSRLRVATSINIPSPNSALTNAIFADSSSEITITSQTNDNYLIVYYWNSGSNLTAQEIEATIQIEKGSTATDYELHENFLTRDYFKDYEQIPSTNYTELDNGRLRYVVNQDTIANEFQPLHELNGLSLNDVFDTYNEILNGDFSNGTTNWLSSTSINANNGYLQIGPTTSQTPIAYQNITINSGNTYYMKADVRLENLSVNDLRIYFQPGGTDVRLLNPDILTWYTLSQNYVAGTTHTNFRLLALNLSNNNITFNLDNVFVIDLTALGIDNLTTDKLDDYYEIYEYFRDGGTDPQTFTYDSPIYYDITYRLDEQFNGLDITAQQFIDFQDGYNRISNNEQANDFIIYYAVQHAQDNNPTLSLTTEQWEQYYTNYLLFEDANTPYIEELNYYSLKEVFEDNNLYSYATAYYNSTFIPISNIEGIETWEYVSLSSSANFIGVNNSYYFNNGDEIYYNYEIQTNYNDRLRYYTRSVYSPYFYITANVWNAMSYKNTFFTQYTNDDRIVIRGDETSNIGDQVLFRNVIIIHLNALNIQHLNQSDLDDFHSNYTNNKTLEQNLYLSALETGSFSLIQPYYDYTAPAPDDFLDVSPDDFLGNILTDIGFDNDLGKSVLAIVILFFTAFTLFKYNMPNSVIIGVTVLTYVGLTFLGWLPAWINIVIAMIFILLMYLRFKGSGGSGNEENI